MLIQAYLKNQEKTKAKQSQENKRKKNTAELNGIENKKTIKINTTKNLFFENINKIDNDGQTKK